MNNTTKILIAILNFIVCLLIGFLVTRMILSAKGNKGGDVEVSATSVPGIGQAGLNRQKAAGAAHSAGSVSRPAASEVTSNSAPAVVESTSTIVRGEPQNAESASKVAQPSLNSDLESSLPVPGVATILEIRGITQPQYNETNKNYSFIVQAGGSGLTYVLLDSKKNVVKTQTSGSFVVKPSSSGKYYVYVTDTSGNKSSEKEVTGCKLVVDKITKQELQEVLNSGKSEVAKNHNFKERVSSRCKYVFSGRDPAEEGDLPESYNAILSYIPRVWRSVSIESVSYNDSGQMVKASIHINY